VEKSGVEALLIDSVHFYVELGAIELGIPYIHVSNAMYSDYSLTISLHHPGSADV
jgi:hypothetical protein